ncbi:MAG: ABC transporter ATP-binding protein [Tissierellia bacterium]|nr:ABC transporter ATP-binding protein [Tissierellia bacterium]
MDDSIKNKKYIFLNILIVLLFSLSAYSLSKTGILMGDTINQLSDKNYNDAFKVIGFISIFVVVGFFSNLLAFRIMFKIASRRMFFIKNKLLKRDIQSKDYKKADYSTNIDTVYQGKFLTIYNIINLVLTMIFAIIALISIDIRAFFVALLASALPLLAPQITKNKLKEYTNRFINQTEAFQHFTYEHLDIKDEISRFNVENKVLERYKKLNLKHEISRLKQRNLINLSGILGSSLGSFSYVLVFLAGSYLVKSNIIKVGAVISLIQLMNYLVEPVVAIVSLKANYDAAKPMYEKINVKEENINSKKEEVKKFDLVVDKLNFSFGHKKIIDDFSKTFEYGKKYLICGESGRGKSTLLRLISGQLNMVSGKIYFKSNGEIFDTKNYLMGYQNQQSKLISDTIYENISFYRSIDEKSIDKIKNKFGIDSSLDRKIDPIDDLSGGEKTRIELMRALIRPKNIMIFDEPTTGLNTKMQKKVIDEILKLDSTVIMVSHIDNREFLDRFDEIIYL